MKHPSLRWVAVVGCVLLAFCSPVLRAQGFGRRGGPPPAYIEAGYDDHKHMMELLGIIRLRPGESGQNQERFKEENANPYKETMPDVLKMNDGRPVTSAQQWPARRAEILELFEREIYGRIPANVPKVTWSIASISDGELGGIPIFAKVMEGQVDNSAFPQISVTIRASFTVPAQATRPVPLMIEFGGVGGGGGRRGRGPGGGGPPSWQQQAIEHGWGYGAIDPNSIQADAGGNALRMGITGLTNKGQPRKPDDWGALRAWGWGVSRLIDYFEATPEANVDPKKVGIEGVSRYGKAAIVTQAFDERIAVAFVASSGAGGVKLHRHIFGEALENLTGGEYYWFAGNLMKYGAAESKDGAKTAADLPVDSHMLIALCAPRPCFISYGIIERGDPQWVDARGSFMAGILAGPVYRLLGKQDFGRTGDYLTEPMPPVGQLIGGELAWRQHEGGHTGVPNFPTFFEWISRYVEAPPLPATRPAN